MNFYNNFCQYIQRKFWRKMYFYPDWEIDEAALNLGKMIGSVAVLQIKKDREISKIIKYLTSCEVEGIYLNSTDNDAVENVFISSKAFYNNPDIYFVYIGSKNSNIIMTIENALDKYDNLMKNRHLFNNIGFVGKYTDKEKKKLKLLEN